MWLLRLCTRLRQGECARVCVCVFGLKVNDRCVYFYLLSEHGVCVCVHACVCYKYSNTKST